MKKLIFVCSLIFSQWGLAQIEVTSVQKFEGQSEITREQGKDSYISEFFGHVETRFSAYASWDITNKGEESIKLLDAALRGFSFWGSTTCPQVIEPKTKCRVDIRFSPMSEGYHSGQLDMIFDKGGNLYFDFWGYGVRY